MSEEIVNVEEIMRVIREQIIARKTAESPDGKPIVRLSGKHLPPEFYEHLYQATLEHDQLEVQLYLTPTTIPIIGPVLHRLRQVVHKAVILYVNKLALQQMKVNRELLHIISLLGEEAEKMQEASLERKIYQN